MALDSRQAATWRPAVIRTGTCEFSRGGGLLGFIAGRGQSVSFGRSMRLRGPDRTVTLLPFNPEYPTNYEAELPKPEPVQRPQDLPPSQWTPGMWTFDSDGSTEVPRFALEVPVGQAIDITNPDEMRIVERSRDLRVQWKPEGLPSGATVGLWLGANRTAVRFDARAEDGAITIPRDVLAGLVPVPEDSKFPATLSLSASRPADQPLVFQVQKTSGESLPFVFTQSSGTLLGVTIR